ncbi:ankyrin repeat domain-containing protein [Motiliproteus sp.]|uniref:ankyrin repeat domain-containing protein n=1 Tax=Motiliproteus sp. TaxID=1898955 RepID=UPI003BAC7982
MLPDTAQAISACKTEDGRTVYNQACLQEMQQKRQQKKQAAESATPAVKTLKQPQTDDKSGFNPAQAAAVTTITPAAEPVSKAAAKPASKPESPPAKRKLVQPAKPAAPQGSTADPKPSQLPTSTAAVKPLQPDSSAKPISRAETKEIKRMPLTSMDKPQQIPTKLSNKPQLAPMTTQLGNPVQTERMATSADKPGCKFTTLVEQVRTGTSDALLACAPSQAQLNQQDQRTDVEGRTLLHWAVDAKQLDMARHLLLQGADSNLPARADRGAKPVHLAAKSGQQELIKLLLKQPQALEAKDYFKRTPLYWAVEAGHHEAAMQLLAAGADPNAQDRIGKSVLMAAVNRNMPNLVAQLLRAGADPSLTNFKGQTVMHLAATDSPATIQLLLQQGISLETLNQEGQTPLLYAASRDPKRYWATIRALVDAGARLDVEDSNQHTLLDYSLAHNHLRLFDLLLDQGLNSDNLRVEQLKGKRAFLQRLLDRGLL